MPWSAERSDGGALPESGIKTILQVELRYRFVQHSKCIKS